METTETEPRLCYSYLRFSGEDQRKGNSTKRQTDLRENYCQRKNLTLAPDRMFLDEAVSAYRGKNATEGDLARFLDLVRSGRVPAGAVLLIEAMDRLSRDEIRAARNRLEEILEAGVEIHTLSPEKIYTRDSLDSLQDLLLMLFDFARSHEYSKQLGGRMSASWASKREKAKNSKTPISTQTPAWLKVVEGKYVVIEERAEIVREIYRLSADGMGTILIAEDLTRRGTPTFSGRPTWNPSYIGKILFTDIAIGNHKPRQVDPTTNKPLPSETIVGIFPAVVSEELNAQAKIALRERKNKGGRVSRTGRINPFSCLLRTHSGASLHVRYQMISKVNRTLVPFIKDRETGKTYPLSAFTETVLSQIAEIESGAPEHAPTSQPINETDRLVDRIEKLERKIQKLKDRIDQEEQIDSFLDLLAGAEKQKKEAAQRLKELRAIPPVDQGLRDFCTMLGGIVSASDQPIPADKLRALQEYARANGEALTQELHQADQDSFLGRWVEQVFKTQDKPSVTRDDLFRIRASLRRLVRRIEVTIGSEHQFWKKKSLRVSIQFRDGTRREFTKQPLR